MQIIMMTKLKLKKFFFYFYFIYKDSYWVELAAVIFTGECQLISCIENSDLLKDSSWSGLLSIKEVVLGQSELEERRQVEIAETNYSSFSENFWYSASDLFSQWLWTRWPWHSEMYRLHHLIVVARTFFSFLLAFAAWD